MPCVKDFIQYYHVGDSVLPKHIGTLGQHFGRFTFVADSFDEVEAAVHRINAELVISDVNGKKMNNMPFDTNRAK